MPNRCWALALLLCSSAALAHDADVIYVQLQPVDGGVAEVATLTAQTLALLAPVDADRDGLVTPAELEARRDGIEAGVWAQMPLQSGGAPCKLAPPSEAVLHATFVELRARFECPAPGELKQNFQVLSVLPGGYRVVLGSRLKGEAGQQFAEGHRQTVIVGAEPPSRVSSFFGWLHLGVFHVLSGLDHVAFLIALLLVGGSVRRLLLLVTAFTVAHSITLGAAALEVIPLGESAVRWVEAAIALSIIWVAAENLILKTHRHRPVLTFVFGLVHGFGFAAVLRDYGLAEGVATGLLGFNLGVEVGQGALVLALYPLVRWLHRRPRVAQITVKVASAAIGVVGAWWLVERVAG
jgi:hypothetical protein